MANKRKIGVVIALDGEKEFKTSVAECNRSLGTLKSEMKLVEAETAGNANSLETLRKKHDVLSRTLEEQIHKEDELKKSLEHAQDSREKVGKQLEEYRDKLSKAETALEEMEAAGNASKESMKAQKEEVDELSKIVAQGEEAFQRAGSRIQNWEKQLNTAKAQTINANRELNKNAAYMKEAEAATDHCAESIDKFGNKTDDTVDRLTELSTTIRLKLNDALVGLGKNAVQGAVSAVTDLQEAENRLAASTGATAEEMERYSGVMEELYRENYGDSIGEVAEAMALVRQYTRETDPSKLKSLTENAIALTDTFGMDLGEAVRGVDSLMENMGLTADEAFDYIVTGAQNGLDKSGELADNIAEYGQLWAQAGFSAEEMFTILQNGLDNGAYNLDKVNDFVKEFGISLSDGRIEENIGKFSNGTKDLFWQWKNGQAATKDVFYSVIHDLSSMTDQQEALTLASNTWSALGEDNAMAILTSLDDVSLAYMDVKGSMESLKEVRYDSIANQYKALGRSLQMDVAKPMLEKFLPAAEKGVKLLADNIDTIVPIAKTAGAAVGTIWAVKKAKNLISDLKDTAKGIEKVVLKVIGHTAATTADTAATAAGTAATVADTAAKGAEAAATGAATVAQEGLNVVMSASPVMLLVGGVGALVGAVALFAKIAPEAKSEADALNDSASEMCKSMEQSQSELRTAMEGTREIAGEAAAKAQAMAGAAEELKRLASQASRTAEEQERMEALVTQLNIAYPEFGLEIDSVTGKLNKGSDEIARYIKGMEGMAEAEAYRQMAEESMNQTVQAVKDRTKAQETLNPLLERQGEIEADIAKIEKELGRRHELLNQTQKELDRELENGEITQQEYAMAIQGTLDTSVEYNGRLRESGQILQELHEEHTKNQESIDGLNGSIEEQNALIGEAQTATEEYTNKYNELTTAADGAAETEGARAEATAAAGEASAAAAELARQEAEAYGGLAETQKRTVAEVVEAFRTMKESVQDSLESQMNMFEKFEAGEKVSTENLLKNMQSQLDGVRNWSDNLQYLADRGINKGLLQYLAELGPQGANYVAAFASMTTEELDEASAMWAQSLDLREEVSGSVADMATEYSTALEEHGKLVADIAAGTGEVIGRSLNEGTAEGIEGSVSLASGAVKDSTELVNSIARQAYGVHSPSKIYAEIGRYLMQGLAQGVQKGEAGVLQSVQAVASQVIRQSEAGLPKSVFERVGQNTVSGMAEGIWSRKGVVESTAGQIAETVRSHASSGLSYQSWTGIGGNVSAGIAAGISSGRTGVINSVAKLCASAIDTAKSKLKIHSPSKIFEELGSYTAEGFGIGYGKEMADVNRMIADSMEIPNAGRAAAVVEDGMRKRTDVTELLQVCLSYLPYLEQMAQTYGQVYLNPREASRELAPFINRDLMALGR